MGKLLKSSRTDIQSDKGRKRGIGPPPGESAREVQRGIYRYTWLSGCVWSVYRETTKKFVGLAKQVGDEFQPCGVGELLEALRYNESKGNKRKG